MNLPWREHHELLPDNYENCVLRLSSTVKRLKKQPEVFKEYNSVIEDQERQGIIEKVDNSTIPEVGKVHYLPHHGVIRQQALSTKLRVVFDASSKAAPDLPSLNECLHVGPALSPKIFDILVRFRQHNVAIVADIEKAFLNVGIEDIDRDVLRFLWIDDLERDNPELLIYRFCRVVFGVNASPFLLNATLQNHIKHCNTDMDFAKKLSESFYVDDLVAGERNDEDAFVFCHNSKECLSKGGFHLRKWVSNSKELLSRIQDDRVKCEINETQEGTVVEDTETYAKTTVGNLEELQETDEHKVLGIPWNCKTDKLCIKFEGVLDGIEEFMPTKRTVLKVAARLYDPLGFVSPVTVLMNMLLQEICARNLDWDTPLPGDLENKWKRWLQSLRRAKYVMISRCLYAGVQEEVQSCSLHGFGDASKGAYCAVLYMLIRTSIGSYARFITSKTRVAPNKNYTIPRLELLSGLILARLASAVKEALGTQLVLESVHLWLDSITAIYWIIGNKEWKQFVQNRVDEILRLTSREMWHHCPGETNPADVGSRGELPENLKNNELWWSGPTWLTNDVSNWPSSNVAIDCPTEECMLEARKKRVSDSVEKTQVTLTVTNNVLNLEEIINANKYSDSERLFRTTAWVLRFVHNLKSRIGISTKEQVCETELLNCEISEAETLWLKTVQKTAKSQPNYQQLEHDLGLFEDEDGVLRCDGRIGNAEISEEAKFPALVPKDCVLVEQLVRSSHKKVYHCKVSSTLAELRTRYWVPSGRQVVKKILSKCCVCRRYEGASYRGPPKVSLPKCRLSQRPAFSYVGVDFAGPLYIKNRKDSDMQKAYIALFSCCSSRALHLELTMDLSVETFIRCLRRFTSRRGVPELIISDNTKTFKAAKKLLNKIFNHPSVRRYCTSKRITWKFNVDRAPWWGGLLRAYGTRSETMFEKNTSECEIRL